MHPLFYEIKKALAGHYPETETSALAKMLLVEKFGFTTLELFGGKDKEVFKKDLDVLNEMLGRLQHNEPIQYIIGHETFCGLTFDVNHHVLIPRPETQELVDWIVNDIKGSATCRILDVGTGSGCIAWTMALEMPGARVTAVDISEAALQVASSQDFADEMRRTGAVAPHFVKADVLADDDEDIPFNLLKPLSDIL